MSKQSSKDLFAEAKKYIPGGVNSPVRSFNAVGGNPIIVSHGKGSKLYDVEGNEYIDYVLSWGPHILGHANPKIIKSVKIAIDKGTSFGQSTELEIVLAKMITEAIPSMQMVRMVNSGTEATMSAIRLARAYTKRDKILKFEGCYHGHSDGLLVKAGSGATTLGVPDSPGVPADIAKNTLTAKFNDIKSVKEIFKNEPKSIACIIVEPIPGNMGLVMPKDGFLEELSKITKRHGALLIFDEVITGFRAAYGGAQEIYGITPDLTCLGKIIGGGFPVGAYGGRRDIMEMISPSGPVYQAGTLSGNPIAMTAGITILELLRKEDIYKTLEEKGKFLSEGIIEASQETGVEIFLTQIGSMIGLFFSKNKVYDYSTAKLSDTKQYGQFFLSILRKGIYIPPSQFETIFISTSHNKKDLEKTIRAVKSSFKEIK